MIASPTESLQTTWLKPHLENVLLIADRAIRNYSTSNHQRELLSSTLECATVFRDVRAGKCTMAVHLPLLVHAGIRGDAGATVGLAAALLLLETGIYTLDHIMDNELGTQLNGWSPSAVLLAATSFLCYLPQRVLLDLDCDSDTTIDLQRMLADGLAKIASGQLADLTSKDAAAPSSEEIENAVCGKTGERRALYAAMAARLARSTPTQIANYAGYARSLGIARQLGSDLIDLFGSLPSRDLASGIRTLPLALFLSRENGNRKDEMLALLDNARKDPSAQSIIRDRLRESGDMRQVLLRKEVHCQRALRLLDAAQPLEPARQALLDAIHAVSLAA
jgi:hypothetical protein